MNPTKRLRALYREFGGAINVYAHGFGKAEWYTGRRRYRRTIAAATDVGVVFYSTGWFGFSEVSEIPWHRVGMITSGRGRLGPFIEVNGLRVVKLTNLDALVVAIGARAHGDGRHDRVLRSMMRPSAWGASRNPTWVE